MQSCLAARSSICAAASFNLAARDRFQWQGPRFGWLGP
uniref:Uncharacterized protein n=1 Tax=Arundo donax TaxID=35708 RepID=A0A0A9HAK2_ARUDO